MTTTWSECAGTDQNCRKLCDVITQCPVEAQADLVRRDELALLLGVRLLLSEVRERGAGAACQDAVGGRSRPYRKIRILDRRPKVGPGGPGGPTTTYREKEIGRAQPTNREILRCAAAVEPASAVEGAAGSVDLRQGAVLRGAHPFVVAGIRGDRLSEDYDLGVSEAGQKATATRPRPHRRIRI